MAVKRASICRELRPLLQTLSQLYKSSEYAEAYGIYSILTSVNGVSSSCLLLEVFSAHALSNLFMQNKIVDFSKLHFMLKSIIDNRIHQEEWCQLVYCS